MKERDPRAPVARSETIRQTLAALLRDQALTARELSAAARIPERDVATHLEHLERSLPKKGDRLRVEPPLCLACGFDFSERRRLGKPSRCPSCRSERLRPARYRIEAR